MTRQELGFFQYRADTGHTEKEKEETAAVQIPTTDYTNTNYRLYHAGPEGKESDRSRPEAKIRDRVKNGFACVLLGTRLSSPTEGYWQDSCSQNLWAHSILLLQLKAARF